MLLCDDNRINLYINVAEQTIPLPYAYILYCEPVIIIHTCITLNCAGGAEITQVSVELHCARVRIVV